MPVPVILLAFANDRDGNERYLRSLPDERRALRAALKAGDDAGKWETVVIPDATLDELLDVFQDARYRGRIAVLHYGGHAGSFGLLLEGARGRPSVVGAAGLASFLAQQDGLELVVLNGCATAGQVDGLLGAGVPAVIATARAIEDAIATQFATRFHAGLAGGATLQRAFAEASGALEAELRAVASATRAIEFDAASDGRGADLHDGRGWPWALRTAEGRETARQWTLAASAGDALWGMPPLPQEIRQPPAIQRSPFLHLRWYNREQASLFFGRGREIRQLHELLTMPDAPPVLLFYGQSGTGKSSVLAAGVLPRLEAAYEVRYARRDSQRPLRDTLVALVAEAANSPSETTWRAAEAQLGRPLHIVLDQVEEVFAQRAGHDTSDEMASLAQFVAGTFGDPLLAPRGRLLLGFRKEWLPEIETALVEAQLAYSKTFLQRLSREGIIEAIVAPSRVPVLRQRYHLGVADGLAAKIADHLLSDPESPVAPTLQVLMATMWNRAVAKSASSPHFDDDGFEALRRDGIALEDFIDQALRGIGEALPEELSSGLVLSVLASYVTRHGTAATIRGEERASAFAHVAESADAIVAEAIDQYLVVDVAAEGGVEAEGATRLAHDTLAPLVRKRCDESDRPGQRVHRILEERTRGSRGTVPTRLLDEVDLANVEAGLSGMRVLSDVELALVTASRDALEHRRRLQALVVAASRCEDPLDSLLVLMHIGEQEEPAGGVQLAAALCKEVTPSSRLGIITPLTCASIHLARGDRGPDVRTLKGQVLTGSRDGTVRLWRLGSKDGPTVLGRHTGAVNSFVRSPYGTEYLSVSSEGELGQYLTDQRAELYPMYKSLTHGIRRASYPSSITQDYSTWVLGVRADVAFVVNSSYVNVVEDLPTRRTSANADPMWSALKKTKTHVVFCPDVLDEVTTSAFSPDGALVVTGSKEGVAVVWRADGSGTPVLLEGHHGAITDARFSTDGERIVTASRDGTARIWRVDGSVPPEVLEGHTSDVTSAAFSHDGSLVITASLDGTLRAWGATRSGVVLSGNAVLSAEFNGTEYGKDLLVRSADGTACVLQSLWDRKTDWAVDGHTGHVRHAEWDEEGRQIVTAADDGTACVWQSWGGSPVVLPGQLSNVNVVAASPVGYRIAASPDERVFVWSGAGAPQVLEGHERLGGIL